MRLMISFLFLCLPLDAWAAGAGQSPAECRGPDGAQFERICSYSGRGSTKYWTAPGTEVYLTNPSSTAFDIDPKTGECLRHTYSTACEYVCHLPREVCFAAPKPPMPSAPPVRRDKSRDRNPTVLVPALPYR